jgi:hypothetical protein
LKAALGDGEGEAFRWVRAADDGSGGAAAEADFEVGAGDEEAVGVRGLEGGGDVGEVDGGEGLFDMEVARFAIEAESIPVEDAIGGVAVLLDLVNEEAGADGVEAAGGDEKAIAGARMEDVDEVGGGAIGEGCEEGLAGDTGVEASVDFGSGFGMGDEPHFGFGFAVELGSEVLWGMDLKAEILAGVQDLHEQREPGGGMGG